MKKPTDEEISDELLGIISDGFNRCMLALETAGAIDRTEMNKHYSGIGSKYYDMVTEQMVCTAKHGTPTMRQLFHKAALASSLNSDSSGSVTHMEPQRQEAYRHLLYTSLLHLRSGHRDVVWWNPASWWRTASELRLCRDLADCFHNLALFTVCGFKGFEEERFWQDIERLGQAHGSKLVVRYRRIFDEYLAGRAVLTAA
jgi:hypothetical protein